MRRALRLAIVAAALAAATARPAAARYEGSADIVAGAKWLSNDWVPVDVQSTLGVMVAFAPERSRVWLAIDILRSRGSADAFDPVAGPTHTTGSTVEYCLGMRKVFAGKAFRPHLGAGGEFVHASLSQTSSGPPVSRRNDSIGLWIEAGFTIRIAKHFDIGIDGRFSNARLDLGQGLEVQDVNAGGIHAGLMLGYGW